MPPNTDQRIAELEKTVRATQAEIAAPECWRPYNAGRSAASAAGRPRPD